jgi:cytidylate kinase
MIVTIGGEVASGKTTLARELARRLGFRHISAGAIMREMAAERGISIIELSEYAESHPEVDREIDRRQKKLASCGDCVVEGRISAYFIPADFKIWLKADLFERPCRARGRGDRDENIINAIRLREASEKKRYKKYYNINLSDLSIYNLVLDTTKLTIKEMVDIVEEEARQRMSACSP